jgi:hypothetical protein
VTNCGWLGLVGKATPTSLRTSVGRSPSNAVKSIGDVHFDDNLDERTKGQVSKDNVAKQASHKAGNCKIAWRPVEQLG